MSTEEDILSLNSNPMYVLEQRKRYEFITTLVGQLQRISKQIAHYAQAGRQLGQSLQSLISEFSQMEFVATSPAFEALLTILKSVEIGFSAHFTTAEVESQKKIDALLKEELPKMNELQRTHMRANERFNRKQEKYLALSKKAKPKKASKKLTKLSSAEADSSRALFELVAFVDRMEKKSADVVESYMVSFLNSLANATCDIQDLDSIEATKESPVNDPVVKRVKRKSLAEALERLKLKKDSQYEGGDGKTQKQGYLWRKSKFGNWEKQFCICSNGVLSGSSSPETAHNPTWSINLLYCSVSVNESEDRQNCFSIKSTDKTTVFQAPFVYDMGEWMDVIRNGIASVLMTGQTASKKPTTTRPNISQSLTRTPMFPQPEVLRTCADCKGSGATWLILNKYLVVCDTCSGIHRSIANVSTIRSLTLDDIDHYTEAIVDLLKGNLLNEYLEKNIGDHQIPPEAPFELRSSFIRKKYVELAFCDRDCEKDVYQALRDHNLVDLLIAILQKKLKSGVKNEFTPMHAAACLGDPYCIAVIAQNSDQIDVLDENGWSPLSYATYYQNVAACQALVDFGANISASRVAHPYLIAMKLEASALLEMYQRVLQADMTAAFDENQTFEPPNTEFTPDDMVWESVTRQPEPPLRFLSEKEQNDLSMAISAISGIRHKRRGSSATRKRPDIDTL